jgi:tetratricopeptide (TPR) repeat protein
MKAEKRKELQTNFLADRMGRLLQGVRTGPQSKSSAAVWVLTILSIGTLLLWYVAGARSNRSPLWVKFEEDALRGDRENLRQLARDNPGTLAARAARFQRARLLLEDGLAKLYSRDSKEAINSVQQARKLFMGLSKECADDSVTASQAILGAAKAEEALVGIPDGDNVEESLGDFDKALQYYRDLVDKYPDTFAGETARKRLSDLEESRAEVEKFYKDMRQQLLAQAPKKP